MAAAVAAPERVDPVGAEDRVALWRSVWDALFALPNYFRSNLAIEGVLATDLFTFNSSLGATIEQQVVDQLNLLRASTWDPDERYVGYRFERQPQTFPDVVLRSTAPGGGRAPLLGIELKGWWVLAKEREPSFRYRVTPAVCAEFDLLVVFPWALSEVVSGSPILFDPFVERARFAAEYRNWWWEHERQSRNDKGVRLSAVDHGYPIKSDAILDQPIYDEGGNFGRLARSHLMDDYITELFRKRLSGIPLDSWQRFLKLFTEDTSADKIERTLDRMAREADRGRGQLSADSVSAIANRLAEVAALLAEDV